MIERPEALFDTVGVGGVEIDFDEGFLERDEHFANDEDEFEDFIHKGVEVEFDEWIISFFSFEEVLFRAVDVV